VSDRGFFGGAGGVGLASLVANRGPSTVVAHRGGGSAQGGIYQGPYPEETLEAYEACLANGLTYLNPHVVMLGDGALVLMHDTTPDRTTNATGAVGTHNYTAPAWRKLKVTPSNTALWPGYGVDWGEQHPPFFSEYLDRFGGRAAHVIECTGRGWQGNGPVATAVVAALQQRGLEKTAIIQSFAIADLNIGAAAGLETMYLPPDLGTAGSDAASIAAAMTSGWAPGKPKHVGINAFPSGQTQAQVVTYIGTLVAAGFTVWAWTLCRRYHQTWLAAAGVVGFITDEPAYFNTTGRVNRGNVDPTSLGVWPHGFLPSDQAHGRGNLTNGGVQLDYAVGSTGTQLCCYGAFSPPASLTAYTVQGDFVWDVLDADATRHMDLMVCCPDDRPTSVTIGAGSGLVDGYQVLFRQNASNLTVARLSQSGQTITNLLIQTTGLPPAVSAGTVTTMKVQVTATQLIVSLIQASTTYGPFAVTDSTFRGGYFHVGKVHGAGTKLVGTWKNISCA
jgi:glycerophosphoryl diester phosphodiesterase